MEDRHDFICKALNARPILPGVWGDVKTILLL